MGTVMSRLYESCPVAAVLSLLRAVYTMRAMHSIHCTTSCPCPVVTIKLSNMSLYVVEPSSSHKHRHDMILDAVDQCMLRNCVEYVPWPSIGTLDCQSAVPTPQCCSPRNSIQAHMYCYTPANPSHFMGVVQAFWFISRWSALRGDTHTVDLFAMY